jgi:hypothetical protein
MYDHEDFQGGTQVVAAHSIAAQVEDEVAARAIVGASAATQADHTMYAWMFGMTNTGTLQLSYDGPAGHVDIPLCIPAPCFFGQQIEAGAAGSYVFHVDRDIDAMEWDACAVCNELGAWAYGADVTMP